MLIGVVESSKILYLNLILNGNILFLYFRTEMPYNENLSIYNKFSLSFLFIEENTLCYSEMSQKSDTLIHKR